MTTVRSKNGKIIKVVSSEEQSNIISGSDAEMDARAVEAVKTAVEKLTNDSLSGWTKWFRKKYHYSIF